MWLEISKDRDNYQTYVASVYIDRSGYIGEIYECTGYVDKVKKYYLKCGDEN